MDTQPASLYGRLGGIHSIATVIGIASVIDDFIDRIMADDRLNANPVDEAHPPGAAAGIQVPGDGSGRRSDRGTQRYPRSHRGRLPSRPADYRD